MFVSKVRLTKKRNNIIAALTHSNSDIKKFGDKLLQESSIKNSPIGRSIIQINKQYNGSAIHWLQQESEALVEKAEFLLANFGTDRFETYLDAVPKNQSEKVWEMLNDKTNLNVFRKLAAQKGTLKEFFTKGNVHSFEFKSIIEKNKAQKFMMGESGNA